MHNRPSSALLRIVAMMLLCSLVLTGCSGLESALDPYSNIADDCSDAIGEYLTPDYSQNDLPKNTEPESTPTEHEHTFTDATCTSPKTCTTCNETEGEPLGHSWTEATCTEPANCSICGEVDGDANGHNWQPATCFAPATCDICGQTDGSALEHNWKSATCTTPKTCKVCGKTKGSTASHKYSKGKCSTCGAEDPSYDEISSSMVWIPTHGGKKYHSHSGCSNMKDPQKVSLSKAKQLGFTACKKCYTKH